MENMKWFNEEDLKLIKDNKNQSSKERISLDTSYLMSPEEEKELFEKVVIGNKKTCNNDN